MGPGGRRSRTAQWVKAQVDQPEFKEALEFYVDLMQDAGEEDAANASFNECLAQYQDGKVAMWYDATVAAGLLEADDSPVKGKNGYALAPVKKTDASGWLWTWALAIPKNAPDTDGRLGVRHVGHRPRVPRGGRHADPRRLGGDPARHAHVDLRDPRVPGGGRGLRRRRSTAMQAAPIDNPGTTKRPGLPGVQYVGVPQFQDVGNQLHRAVLERDRRSDERRRRARSTCQQIASQAIE